MPFQMSRKIRLARAGVEILQTTISSSSIRQMASPGIKPRSQRSDDPSRDRPLRVGRNGVPCRTAGGRMDLAGKGTDPHGRLAW